MSLVIQYAQKWDALLPPYTHDAKWFCAHRYLGTKACNQNSLWLWESLSFPSIVFWLLGLLSQVPVVGSYLESLKSSVWGPTGRKRSQSLCTLVFDKQEETGELFHKGGREEHASRQSVYMPLRPSLMQHSSNWGNSAFRRVYLPGGIVDLDGQLDSISNYMRAIFWGCLWGVSRLR